MKRDLAAILEAADRELAESLRLDGTARMHAGSTWPGDPNAVQTIGKAQTDATLSVAAALRAIGAVVVAMAAEA